MSNPISSNKGKEKERKEQLRAKLEEIVMKAGSYPRVLFLLAHIAYEEAGCITDHSEVDKMNKIADMIYDTYKKINDINNSLSLTST